MEAIKLDKRKFQWFNDCDHNNLFGDKMNALYNSLSKEEKENFVHEHYIELEIEKLFNAYDHILVTHDNNLWGVKGNDITEIKSNVADAYECAMAIK